MVSSVLGTELYKYLLLSCPIRRKYKRHFRHVLQLASARQDTRCSAVSKVHVHTGTTGHIEIYPRRRSSTITLHANKTYVFEKVDIRSTETKVSNLDR